MVYTNYMRCSFATLICTTYQHIIMCCGRPLQRHFLQHILKRWYRHLQHLFRFLATHICVAKGGRGGCSSCSDPLISNKQAGKRRPGKLKDAHRLFAINRMYFTFMEIAKLVHLACFMKTTLKILNYWLEEAVVMLL